MLNVVAKSQSRGALLALAAVGLLLPFVAKGRLKSWAIAGLVIGSLLGVRLFAEEFWQRMSTMESYQEDGSALGRIYAWIDAWELSLRNPIGWGGEAFDKGLRTGSKTTHNMYFECLVAWGFQGTFLWLAFLGKGLLDSKRLITQLHEPGRWPPRREYLEAVAIFTGLVSMLVAAVFLNRMRWELWWVYSAYIVCLKNEAAAIQRSRFPEAGLQYAEFPNAFAPRHRAPAGHRGLHHVELR
jgi:O-antigen ligase